VLAKVTASYKTSVVLLIYNQVR